jgi:olefin beta-lactone synthetase
VNAISLFDQNARKTPEKMGIADIRFGELSFSDIQRLSCKTQTYAKKLGLTRKDSVLVALTPSPVLYGVICGLMGLGIQIVFIEPWLPLEKINHVLKTIQPKLFLSGLLGKAWGVRSQEIRNIPIWASGDDILSSSDAPLMEVRDLAPEHPAFVVFSSGTTGAPKGVVRTHAFMQNIFNVFTELEDQNDFNGPDLIIFPNVALFHLATGRGSVLVPQRWTKSNMAKLLLLCEKYSPPTLSTGPAFFKKLIDFELLEKFRFLNRIVLGGALTDNWILERLMNTLPHCEFKHLYGGSEAEPVTMIDGKEALLRSKEKGFFQLLCVGEPIPQIETKFKDDNILWVAGPHVSKEYIGDQSLNAGIKERDPTGKLWHCMGDRLRAEEGMLWFAGRQGQDFSDFELEQKIYHFLSSSKSFLHRSRSNELLLIGEGLKSKSHEIHQEFPQISKIIESKIVRDHRHRARINRHKSLPFWLRIKL